MECNGRDYPMWGQFVERESDFIGKRLEDSDMGMHASTIVEGVTLKPNGDDSAFFSIVGKDFTCGFDVQYGGVCGGDRGWLTFSGYGGHTFRVANK